MDKSILNGSPKRIIYDCVGIGFGPSNIALAIAMEEKGLLENSLFLEARDEVLWHPGMLIQGTDIQHNPLRDFVTPRNPCSQYGFLSYLKSENRLFDYLNLSAPFPPRTEYAKYIGWVAKQFAEHVHLGVRVSNISCISDDFDGDLLAVETDEGQCFVARTVVLGPGRSRNIPPEFQDLLCEDVIHSDDYLPAKTRWLCNGRGCRIAVVGGSQSAIEILLDLAKSTKVVGIARGFGYQQKDLSPFTERIYFPAFVEYFHSFVASSQNEITSELWRSNYSSADHDVINALNFQMYEQKVNKKSDIQLFSNSKIEHIETSPRESVYSLHLIDRYSRKPSVIAVDGIIFATGYKNFGRLENQELIHPLLKTIAPNVVFREDGGPDVLRDYQLNKVSGAPLYLNGLCEASHGFGDAGSFSLISVRGDVIASSLQNYLQHGHEQNVIRKIGAAAHA